MIELCHYIFQLQYFFLMNEGNNSVCILFNHHQLIYHIHYLIKILNFSVPITPYLNTTSQKTITTITNYKNFHGTLTTLIELIYYFIIIGSVTGPERVSPPVVFLTPPEKLVLEVRVNGGYDLLLWSRVGDSSFSQNPTTELINFHEVFVRQPTTSSEYGTYGASYALESGQTRVLVVPTGMLFYSIV